MDSYYYKLKVEDGGRRRRSEMEVRDGGRRSSFLFHIACGRYSWTEDRLQILCAEQNFFKLYELLGNMLKQAGAELCQTQDKFS